MIKILGDFKTEIQKGIKNIYADFIKKSINELASIGATKVDPENQNLRLKECANCPFRIRAEVVAFVEADTCGWVNPKTGKACGCIVELKSQFDKYRNPKTGKISQDHCERWQSVDKKYKSEKATT